MLRLRWLVSSLLLGTSMGCVTPSSESSPVDVQDHKAVVLKINETEPDAIKKMQHWFDELPGPFIREIETGNLWIHLSYVGHSSHLDRNQKTQVALKINKYEDAINMIIGDDNGYNSVTLVKSMEQTDSLKQSRFEIELLSNPIPNN